MLYGGCFYKPPGHIIYNMTYGIIRIRNVAHRRERAEHYIWNPRTNDWDPLDYRTMGKVEKHGWPVMGKPLFESEETYVIERWMALPMMVIEELGLANYVLETMEKRPKWQVVMNE